MSKIIKISVILITKDRHNELGKTLLSLNEQDIDFELIVVDNGSSESPHEIVRKHWPKAILIKLDRNEGVCRGRNEGIKAANGDILVFLDDDATFEAPDALSRILFRFKDTFDLGILATNSRLEATGEADTRAIPRRDKNTYENDYEASYFSGVGFAVRRSLTEKTGRFFEKYFYACEELDLSWRAMDIGYRIIWAADIVVFHRRSPVEKTIRRWIYYNTRNRVWLAVRHLPWRYVTSYLVLWWGYLFVKALKSSMMLDYFKGIVDCISGLPEIMKERRLLSDATLKLIRVYNGRLFY